MSRKKGYLTNPPNFCGPYAVYNAKIWRGEIDNIEDLIIRCKTNNYIGTRAEDMSRVLNKDFDLKTRRSNDSYRIKDALSKGFGVILGYKADHTDGHFAFFFKEKGQLYSVNDRKDTKIVEAISEELFDKYLKKHYIQCVGSGLQLTHPKAWFIPQKN